MPQMKKNILIALLFVFSVVTAQDTKIDFRTTDLKLLNKQQMREYQRWRDEQFRLLKTTGLQSEVKSLVITGNKIRSIIYNTGAISNPGVQGNVLDLVWNGLGYGYEFGPLVTARVPRSVNPNDSVNIVIDGFGGSSRNTADGDFAPNNVDKWGWLPKSGYASPGQNDLASWGARTSDLRLKPRSWPESWYNSVVGEYIYPSFLGGNATVPDEEVYYIVDDSTDAEFDYYPMPTNLAHRGLGVNLEVRTMQFANPLAEDIIFLVYTAENDPRAKGMPKMYFGMFGDPHIGGPSNFADDAAEFIPARPIGLSAFDTRLNRDGKLTTPLSRNMVFSWDPDAKGDLPAYVPGYFGYKFLESPNNSIDGIDNDDDGIKDENPFNDKGTFIDGVNVPLMTGVNDSVKYIALYGQPKARWSGDEDGDWDKEKDDIGVDGIFGTGDFGEGNGVPDQLIAADGSWLGSEPNFGFRDVNESDQIGLRSFWSLTFGGNNRPKNDNLMYNSITAEFDTAALATLYDTDPTNNLGDYIFLYGSGPFEMHPGHRERFSIALLMGSDLKDLLLNSETAQLVLQANYRFAQPPPKPKVTAVAGNGKVTLYWDNAAESTTDPFSGKKDFEGYKIYRSQDYSFKDVFSVTDGNGYPFLGKALYDNEARRSAQWHRPWTKAEQDKYDGGFMPVEYRGRFIKYYMGEPSDTTGLRHEYVDSTVTNGITYYYAVVSFDHGDDTLQLPPSESQAIIQRDAVTQEFKFDVNTVSVVPNADASGLISYKADLQTGVALSHTKGVGTGTIQFKVLNELALKNGTYGITFAKTKIGIDTIVAYSVLRKTPAVEQFIGNENLFVNLQNKNFVSKSVRIYDGPDTNAALIPSTSIFVDSANGRLRATAVGVLLRSKSYTVSYQYYPVAGSGFYKANDANPVFDGIRLYVTNDTLLLDGTNTGFASKQNADSMSMNISSTYSTLGRKAYPIDYRITFMISTADRDTLGNYIAPPDSFISSATLPSVNKAYVKAPFKVENMTDTTKLTVIINEKTGPNNKAGRWDFGEEIIILEVATPVLQSKVFHNISITRKSGVLSYAIPAGSVVNVKMRKPFAANDEYEFTTKAVSYSAAAADALLQNAYVVPNPYVISSAFELPSNRPDLRGDRVIQFRNLPRECTIRIYTITGDLVQTLRKNDITSTINWDLLSSESARIGYGVYIYHIETPTGGKKIGRLGLIK